ncbi:MAG: glycosyltransferase [Planctomycetia bacterium]|jgi:glycosyltransferase involved in cell wall biosynthesis
MTVQTNKNRLSVALIARDEEGTLPQTLASVEKIADEIVVLDTGSADNTLAAAVRFGARVVSFDWCEDFSAARNALWDQLQGDWVLWLDAGERIDTADAKLIHGCVNEQIDQERLFMLTVEVPAAAQGASNEQILQPRLVPNRQDIRFEGPLRETLLRSAQAVGLMVETLPVTLRKTAAYRETQRCKGRAYRDLMILEAKCEREGTLAPREFNACGEAYAELNDTEKARDAFEAAINVASHGSTEMLEGYYGLLTTYNNLADHKDVFLNTCIEALEIFPFDAQLHLAMGHCLQNRGELDLAARSFSTAVEYGQVNLETWHLSEIAEVPTICLSTVMQLQGKQESANMLIDEAIRRSVHSPRFIRHAIELKVKRAEVDDALRLVSELDLPEPEAAAMCEAVRGACAAAQNNLLDALGHLENAFTNGCHEAFCLRWLLVTLTSSQHYDAATEVLEHWKEREGETKEIVNFEAAIQQRKAISAALAEAKTETDNMMLPEEEDEEEPINVVTDVDDDRYWRVDQSTTITDACAPAWPNHQKSVDTTDFASEAG